MTPSKYKCLKCHHHWMTQKPSASVCPSCGNPYVSWLNYEEWKKAPGKTLRWTKADRG